MNLLEGSPDIGTDLRSVHESIDACHVCSGLKGFVKSTGLKRGDTGRIIVIGQGPGNKEIQMKAAFSGQSGKKLDEWLVKCGASVKAPRTGIYFTSVVKCGVADSCLSKMIHNCRKFLFRQLSILNPDLIITLGQIAYEELQLEQVSYNAALCKLWKSSDYVLMTPWGAVCPRRRIGKAMLCHPSPTRLFGKGGTSLTDGSRQTS